MATITLRLSTKTDKVTNQHEILMRFRHGKVDQYAKTNIFVHPDNWEANRFETYGKDIIKNGKNGNPIIEHKKGDIKKDGNGNPIIADGHIKLPKVRKIDDEGKKQLLNEVQQKIDNLNNIKSHVQSSFQALNKNDVTKDWLQSVIDEFNFTNETNNTANDETHKSFFEWFELFMTAKDYPNGSAKAMRVVERALGRYQGFCRAKRDKDFTLDINTITKDTIVDFFEYFKNEYQFAEQYPELFKKLLHDNPTEITKKHKTAKIEERGYNHIVNVKKKLKSFFNWLNKEGHTTNHPFDGIEIGGGNYGDPIILSIDERNKIGDFDLSATPHLERQRDVFIFQCLIGCRVGDLLKMTPDNVVDGEDGLLYIQYIPRKTKEKKPVTATIPLNERATALLAKYKDMDLSAYSNKNNRNPLLPFISSQKYNEAIKEIFKLCGMNRMVIKLNPISGEEESKHLYEVASSHMARRCFVGNLYNKVADPNLIGSMSGHVENSKAFARYRKIEMENKKKAVDLIN